MRTLSWAVALGMLLLSGAAVRAAEPSARKPISYQKDIAPILAQACYSCHGEGRSKGGLRVDSLAAITKGGNSGPAIVSGKSGQSLLVKKSDEEDPTPHKGAVLSVAQIALVKTWIDRGAPLTADQPTTGPAPRSDSTILEVDLDKLPPDLARQLREFLEREKKAPEKAPARDKKND
jgi:hypothetical protein